MKKVLLGSLLILTAGFFSAFTSAPAPVAADDAVAKITWYSFAEAIEMSKKDPKKIFVDVYTDWCGWCKKMDKSTFTDPKVIEYMNENFYAVKFNAEQKDPVDYKGYTLKYHPDAGRRGVHELAYALLDGRMGYPAFVYLDENQDRITISPGYKTPEVLLPEMKFVAEEHYKDKSYEEFKKMKP